MKLVAFRVVNFRSILDTGWHDLSTDNITGLIGQNESGKTSVLEALYAFRTGELEEDFLRDEKLYPEVSCSFEFEDGELERIFAEGELPDAVTALIKEGDGRVNLTRNWTGLKKAESTLSLERDDLIAAFSVDEEGAEGGATTETAEVSPAVAGIVKDSAEGVDATPQEEVVTIGDEDFLKAIWKESPEFVYFVDNESLLPAKIDLQDITAVNSKAPGIKGAKNLLTIGGITTDEILSTNDRVRTKKIRAANQLITKGFQEFWRQYIGKNNKIEIQFDLAHYSSADAANAGKPYLTFWVKDGQEMLHPAQRSKGVQWFLSFFLQLKASAQLNSSGQVLLIDEPGASLHAKAQEDVLEVFEDIKSTLQIIYTTHSPYLIQADTLYRLLAVQRANEQDDNSETLVFGAHEFGGASEDTLLPIYTLIGAGTQYQRVIEAKDNVILEEPSAFYYLRAFKKLIGEERKINFVPSSGVGKVPLLVNLFLGWGLDFLVLVDEDDAGKRSLRKIKKDVYGNDESLADKHLMYIKDCEGIEDLFTKTDFRTHVLQDSALTYEDTNSKYIGKSADSKVVVAIKFYQQVESGAIALDDLNKKTQQNVQSLFRSILERL